MNKDFLLDAIGQIDDELILDAELAPPLPQAEEQKRRPIPSRWRYWGGIAAAVAVCIGLWAGVAGGVLPAFWMGGGAFENATAGGAAPGSPGMSGGAAADPNGAASGILNGAEGDDWIPQVGGYNPMEDGTPSSPFNDPVYANTSNGKYPTESSESPTPTEPPTSPESPASSEPPEEQQTGSLILISGGWYVPSQPAALSQGSTALGVLTYQWELDSGKEDGTLDTAAPEYDGLTVWQDGDTYLLELADGSFMTLVPWTE